MKGHVYIPRLIHVDMVRPRVLTTPTVLGHTSLLQSFFVYDLFSFSFIQRIDFFLISQFYTIDIILQNTWSLICHFYFKNMDNYTFRRGTQQQRQYHWGYTYFFIILVGYFATLSLNIKLISQEITSNSRPYYMNSLS